MSVSSSDALLSTSAARNLLRSRAHSVPLATHRTVAARGVL